MNPKLKLLQDRAKYRSLVRAFFEARDFQEVVTPLLVKNPGLEPNIQYFETEFKPLMGKGERTTYYLPTSPEYHLKKALAWGAQNIFELTRSFRNGELGQQHSPEFEMLEWYRQPGKYEDIARDVEALLANLWKKFQPQAKEMTFKHEKVRDLFLKFELDLEDAQIDSESFKKTLESKGVETHPTDTFDDLFHRAFLKLVEPNFSKNEILFLWDFPAPLRALSKLSDNKYFCKRFEVYWGTVELGNAFDELIDPEELRAVCESDRKKRLAKYGKTPDLDEEFLLAHSHLQPQIGGIAMGLDRILQWLLQADNLNDVLLYGVSL